MLSIDRAAKEFLFLRNESNIISERKNLMRDQIKELMKTLGYVGPDGHTYYDLSAPISFGGTSYNALRNTRRSKKYIDTDRLVSLAKEKGVTDRVVRTEVIEFVDTDEAYVLVQEGIFSEEEIDSLIDEEVTYALEPLEGTFRNGDEERA